MLIFFTVWCVSSLYLPLEIMRVHAVFPMIGILSAWHNPRHLYSCSGSSLDLVLFFFSLE